MLDLKILWIGDSLRIKSSGKEGVFAGLGKDGKARIKYKGKILLVKSTNLEIVEDQEEDELINEENLESTIFEIAPSQPEYNFTNELDLHINKLNPELENGHPQLIIDNQLVVCREFIKHSIKKKKNVVTIVHGKGKGVLKAEVLHLLKEFSNVRFAIEINDGGAQEVWLKY